jgi:serine protease Do
MWFEVGMKSSSRWWTARQSTKPKKIGGDPGSDIAVIKVDAQNLKPITFSDSDKIKAGDLCIAIGNPFALRQSVTMGIISATGRNQTGISEFGNFIQTDAAINPGNSGGPWWMFKDA